MSERKLLFGTDSWMDGLVNRLKADRVPSFPAVPFRDSFFLIAEYPNLLEDSLAGQF